MPAQGVAVWPLVVTALVWGIGPPGAFAMTVSAGQTITATFTGPTGSLSSTASITLATLIQSSAMFSVVVTNNSDAASPARIMSLGFTLSPEPAAADIVLG